jgi:hypothetical protein
MRKKGFDRFNIKRSKINSKYRIKKGIPTIMLLEKDSFEDWDSIETAAHEVGHALDLKFSEARAVMYYVYVYIAFAFLTKFSSLFLIPAITFAIICTILYVRNELNADANKRTLINQYLKNALKEFNDNRDGAIFIDKINKRKNIEVFQAYKIGILVYIIFPLVIFFMP